MKNHIRIVPHLDGAQSLIFNVLERDFEEDTVLKLGRFTDKLNQLDKITFKSKVVSRGHAEIWFHDDQFYIKDTKSSSGTFVNRVRLSLQNQVSDPYRLRNGDIIQLGVDYLGGYEEMYRCVRMRIEINQPSIKQSLSSFGLNSFKTLKKNITCDDIDDIDECCICLYALAPFQALFVAPCSHTFHFKCCFPLLKNYPGFNCPLCRSYADLDANVAIDTDEVVQMLKNTKCIQETNDSATSSSNMAVLSKINDCTHINLQNLQI